MMSDFYKARLTKQRLLMMKYMRYIFNDHFLLVMLIAIGGFGLYYSEFVKSIHSHFIIAEIAGILICFFTLLFGKLATLMKEADSIFLLPKERQMRSYFVYAIKHSVLLPFFVIFIVTAVTLPLFVATSTISFSDFVPLVLTLWGLKLTELIIQLMNLYLNTKKKVSIHLLLWGLISLIAIGLNVFVNPWVGLPISLAFLAYIYYDTKKTLINHSLDWSKAIFLEKKRMKKIYSFINLFTDVPGLSVEVKRRAYFDFLLKRIKMKQSQTYFYLYTRVFLRGTEYSNLVLRLSVIGGLILIFSQGVYLDAIIGLLFLYLIGFQLLPLYNEFDYMLMTELYPIKKQQKTEAVKRIISYVLVVVTFIFCVIILLSLDNKTEALFVCGLLVIESVCFIQLYAKKRLKKMEKTFI